MADIQKHLELLEKRITILERQVARLSPPEEQSPTRQAGEVVELACDDPGMVYSRAYHVEIDGMGRKFCWLGNDGPIQIIVPVAPSLPLRCVLVTFPHPQVSLESLRLVVNDVETPAIGQSSEDGLVAIEFNVPESYVKQLDVWLHNVPSVRPSDVGEGGDVRLLALSFYGAIVTYL